MATTLKATAAMVSAGVDKFDAEAEVIASLLENPLTPKFIRNAAQDGIDSYIQDVVFRLKSSDPDVIRAVIPVFKRLEQNPDFFHVLE